MIGDVTFYPNYLWSAIYAEASEPSIVGQGYASSGGETTGPLYDLVDAKRTTVLTVDTDAETTDFNFDIDCTYNVACNFTILDNHNCDTANADVIISHGGTAIAPTSQYSGTLGSALVSQSLNGNWVLTPDDGVLLIGFSSVTDNNWELYFQDNGGTSFADDVTAGEWFVGKSFSPATAPELYDISRNYKGINVNKTLGGQTISKKYYGERKAWTLKWSYVSESDKDSFLTLFEKTEGPRYPFYIDLGEESTPVLNFVRLADNTLTIKKLAASAYEVSFTIESEV